MAEDWPSTPQHRDAPRLPVVEDLPVAWEGYDRGSVDAAFDAFYRHIAQLDATLRALEAVEAFREEAADLRADLRSIRAAGWSPYPRGYALAPERSLFGSLPSAVPRVALEIVFLVAVAAVVAVADFTSREVVGVIAGAVAITFLVELVASRDRRAAAALPADVPPEETGPELVVADVPAAPFAPAADDAVGWAAFAEAADGGAESVLDALASDDEAPVRPAAVETPAAARAAGEQAGEATEEAPPPEEPPPPAELAPEAQAPAEEARPAGGRRRRARRRKPEELRPEPEAQPALEPKHVRVLPPSDAAAADDATPAWERGFDETGELR